MKLGKKVTIYNFVNLYGCEIGDNSKVGTFVEIQNGAKIGANCKISSHTFICEGVIIEDGVFIGLNETFINDRYPRATRADGGLQTKEDWSCIPTIVKRGASIGSSATILCGVTIGQGAMVGAGSVVTKDVSSGAVVAGNPASPDFSHSDYEKAFRSGIVAVPTTTYARRERPHDANRVYPEPVRLSRPRHQEGSRRI